MSSSIACRAVAGQRRGRRDGSGAAPLLGWADLMRRAFEIDVLACPRGGGPLRLIAIIEDPRVIEAILSRLTSAAERADRAPPPVLSQQARSCRGL